MKTIQIILLSLALVCGLSAGAYGATFVQTTPYLSDLHSPFDTAAPGYHIEDFEDLILNTPGASMFTDTSLGISAFSVDVDDGFIDGSGTAGKSLSVETSGGVTGVWFTFDDGVLGQFPQNVGIVVTNAHVFPLTIETFGPLGLSQGTTDVTLSVSGVTTNDDVFLGVTDLGGISRLYLYSNSAVTFVHLDHLQYGPVPEPATMSLLAIGGLGVLMRRKRRKKA